MQKHQRKRTSRPHICMDYLKVVHFFKSQSKNEKLFLVLVKTCIKHSESTRTFQDIESMENFGFT